MNGPSALSHEFQNPFGNASSALPQPLSENVETVSVSAAEASVLARMLEMERLRNTQLEGLRQMRTHLHINLAHELRTPLAAVRGYARMVLEGRAGEITDRQREYLTIVTENTDRMIHLVSWMSRVFDIGEHEMRLEIVDFLKVWSECFSKHQSGLLEKSIDVAVAIPRERFSALADRNQICRIFDQLLCASVRFSDRNAQLSITFSHGREQEITVKVAGISQEVPSDCADQSERSLSNLYDAVGVHGGRFFVRRTPEDRTILLVTLPAILNEFH